jgi:hypothetical protein
MLDRKVVGEFLADEMRKARIRLPRNIPRGILVEIFCRYVEDDFGEWLKDNFRSFFEHGNPDWDWVRERIQYYRSNP